MTAQLTVAEDKSRNWRVHAETIRMSTNFKRLYPCQNQEQRIRRKVERDRCSVYYAITFRYKRRWRIMLR